MRRRHFLTSALVAPAAAQAQPDGCQSNSVVVSRMDDRHEAFPDMARLKDGALLVVYRESNAHEATTFCNIVLRRSRDNGRTWSGRQVLISEKLNDGVIFKWNCPRIGSTGDGRLYLVCDRIAYPPGESGDFKHAKVFLWWSKDEGKSWSGPSETPVFGIVPGKLVELSSGAWLLSTHFNNAETNKRIQIVHRSTDGGRRWEGPITICADPRYSSNEGAILELPGRKLVCYMRENSNKGWPAQKCFSSDEGRTWSGPFPTLIGGCHRPVAGYLPDGRILITYRFNQGGARFPLSEGRNAGRAHNVFACLEPPESAAAEELSRQSGLILPIAYDRSPKADTGYTGWVNLPDGRVFMVTYLVDEAPAAYIRGYYFGLRDFFLPG
ncbi:MAG: sialidase family protein [Acidobacteriota bacterium]